MTVYSAYNDDVRISRSELRAIPTPAARGRYHQPLPFGEFVDEVEWGLKRIGLEVVGEEHLIGHEGNRYFGSLEIAPLEGELIRARDWNLFVALRGSHDQSIPRGIALGRSVMVCSNLCFWGDLAQYNTKQTLNARGRISSRLYKILERIPDAAHNEERRVAALQGFEINAGWKGDAALVEIHRRGALSGNQLARAIKEWDNPTYPEHLAHGRTAWTLEQAVTEALKPSRGGAGNLQTLQERSAIATDYINSKVINYH